MIPTLEQQIKQSIENYIQNYMTGSSPEEITKFINQYLNLPLSKQTVDELVTKYAPPTTKTPYIESSSLNIKDVFGLDRWLDSNIGYIPNLPELKTFLKGFSFDKTSLENLYSKYAVRIDPFGFYGLKPEIANDIRNFRDSNDLATKINSHIQLGNMAQDEGNAIYDYLNKSTTPLQKSARQAQATENQAISQFGLTMPEYETYNAMRTGGIPYQDVLSSLAGGRRLQPLIDRGKEQQQLAQAGYFVAPSSEPKGITPEPYGTVVDETLKPFLEQYGSPNMTNYFMNQAGNILSDFATKNPTARSSWAANYYKDASPTGFQNEVGINPLTGVPMYGAGQSPGDVGATTEPGEVVGGGPRPEDPIKRYLKGIDYRTIFNRLSPQQRGYSRMRL